jgi:2-C-methyl-D-erythritol 4-phosphate cytidylyltransferase
LCSVTDVADGGHSGRGEVRSIVWTIVVGAGRGKRFGGLKQYERLGGQRVIDAAVAAAHRATAGVVKVVPPADATREQGIAGGPTRSASVRAGLAVVPRGVGIICVHDASRPLASARLFDAVVSAVCDGADAAVPAVPVADTIKLIDRDGLVVGTLERSNVVAVQTPQAFRAEVLIKAHATREEGSDDAQLVERLHLRVMTVPGEPWNRKITKPEDLEWARRWIRGNAR